MGRNRMYNHGMLRAYRGGNSTRDPYYCDWGAVVGDGSGGSGATVT